MASIFVHKGSGKLCTIVSYNGQRKYLYADTVEEIEKKIKAYVKPAKPVNLTVSDLVNRWLGVSKPEMKPTAYARAQSLCSNYITPTLGRRSLSRLTTDDILSAVETWRKRDVASGTILNAYRVLHRLLVCGVRWKMLKHNPCDDMDSPKVQRKEAVIWTVEQAQRFLEAAKGDRYYPLWLFLMGSSCRLGEALGLQWDDIEGNVVSIRRSLSFAGNKPILQTPKTKTSRRSVAIPEFVVEALREWKLSWERDSREEGWQDKRGAVFVTKNGTPPLHQNLRRQFQSVCRRAKVPICRIHDLRHLSATLLVRSGLDLKSVQSRLGHSSLQMTLGLYAHAVSSSDRIAAGMLDSVIRSTLP